MFLLPTRHRLASRRALGANVVAKTLRIWYERSSLIINVEYNQLDPILRATVSPEGDVNDPKTGLSPFPGNTNNLVFKLEQYLKVWVDATVPSYRRVKATKQY